MNVFQTLCKAIAVRQGERESEGYPAMNEMEISRELWDGLSAELTVGPLALFLTHDPTVTETQLMGVKLKVIGE